MFAERAPQAMALASRDRRALAFSVMFAEIAAPVMHEELVGVVDTFQPELIVHEVAELAAAPIAKARGIPHVAVGFSGALPDAAQAAAEQSVAVVWESEGLQVTTADFHGDVLLHPFPTELDTPRSDGPAAPMRPLAFDGAMSTTPPDWTASFGAERPGVYVTFGTEFAHLAPWPAIFDALADVDVDVIATVGGRIDPATFAPTAANIRIEQYVPQGFLLDRAQVVVSHGGAGTLIGAASAGKVQLCLPVGADQWENADSLSAARAGMTLEVTERDAETIARSVEHLLSDTSTQASAEYLRNCFAAMPHPADVVAELEHLAESRPDTTQR